VKIDVLARRWGSPKGGLDGMSIAAAYFAYTLELLGHAVRRLAAIDGWEADLVVTTISPTWKRTAAMAIAAGATQRLVFWHHHGALPEGHGCIAAATPASLPGEGWIRHVVLPPSSWAAERGGACLGREVLVAGAGPAKGGHVALEVARQRPERQFYVLPGRCSSADLLPWRELGNAAVAPGQVEPEAFLCRAGAVLAPTRFEVHPLLLVEAATRGIPIVCSDLPGTRAAAQGAAIYLPVTASPEAWAAALDRAANPGRPLRLAPYADVVREALAEMVGAQPQRAVG
jgi:glycosyltransferase involved in cell wall biosynthesis